MNSCMKFAIVKFPLEDDCPRAVVPISWLINEDKECHYPTGVSYEKTEKLIKTESQPNEEWSICSVIVMRKYWSYQAARLDLPRSELTSNLESEEEDKGAKKKRRRMISKMLIFPGEDEVSGSEDTDETPYPKKKIISFPALNTLSSSQPAPSFSPYPTSSLHQNSSPLPAPSFSPYPTSSLHQNSSPLPAPSFSPYPTSSPRQSSSPRPAPSFSPCPTSSSHQSSSPLPAPSFSPCPTSSPHQMPSAQPETFSPCQQLSNERVTMPNSKNRSLQEYKSHRHSTITNEQIYQGIMQIQASIADIFNRVKSIEERVDSIVRSNGASPQMTEDSEEVAMLSLLPLSSMDDYRMLEGRINGNPIIRKKFVKVIMAVGGKDSKSLTINVMRWMFTDELATSFSYTGKKGFKEEKTEAFGNSEICNCIHAAVLKCHSGATNDYIKKLIMGFLNQAKTRISRRDQPKQNNQQNSNSD